MVAMNAVAGSTPLAWVNVATWKLVNVRDFVRTAPETAIGGSANEVVTLALLFAIVPVTVAELLAVFGSELLALTEAVLLKAAPLARLVGALTTTLNVSELPEAMLPDAVAVAVPPDCENVKASLPAVFVI